MSMWSENSQNQMSCLRRFLINSIPLFFFLSNHFALPRTPFFELKGLEPGMSYDVMVMAVNKKGKSGPVILQGYTLKSPEKQTGN